MDVTRTIVYRGGAARVAMLAQMLRSEGVQVEYTPPEEQRGIGGDLNEVVVNLVSTGTVVAIGAAVKKFRERVPRAKVKVEGEDAGEAAPPEV